VKQEQLEEIRQRLNAATPGPWVDITAEWNKALEKYAKTKGVHWHSALRGYRRNDAKMSPGLIVSVPETLNGRFSADEWYKRWENLNMRPDWYDFKVIVGLPYSALKREGGYYTDLPSTDFSAADRAFIANAPTDIAALLSEIERLQTRIAELTAN
jgi:hypothetical protein